jgi:hypothetical protein
MDLARDVFGKAMRYAKRLPPEALWVMTPQLAGRPFPADKADDFVKEFMKRMEEQEDQITRNVQTRVDQVQRRTNLRDRYVEALELGLPGMALKIFRDTPDPNEFGSAKLEIVVAQIRTELRAGQLEQGAADLTALAEEIEALVTKQPNAPISVRFRQLQSLRARLEGDYAAVAEIQNKTAMPTLKTTVSNLPLLAALRAPDVVERGGLAAVVGMPALFQCGTPLDRAVNEWRVVREVLAGEVAYQFDRGLLALLDGNVREARQRMEQALRPQGVDLSEQGGSLVKTRILWYLDVLRRYENAK